MYIVHQWGRGCAGILIYGCLTPREPVCLPSSIFGVWLEFLWCGQWCTGEQCKLHCCGLTADGIWYCIAPTGRSIKARLSRLSHIRAAHSQQGADVPQTQRKVAFLWLGSGQLCGDRFNLSYSKILLPLFTVQCAAFQIIPLSIRN